MKPLYKKVGDVLSLYEYNAIAYLISQNKFYEEIELEMYNRYEGRFGTYVLYDEDHALAQTKHGLQIKDPEKTFYIAIIRNGLNADYKLMPHVKGGLKIVQKISDGEYKNDNISVNISPTDLYDKYGDDSSSDEEEQYIILNPVVDTVDGIPVRQYGYSSVHYSTNVDRIYVKPSTYGFRRDDYIDIKATVELSFSEPEINLEDGGATIEGEILCESFEDLCNVIESTKKNTTTSIRLLGKTYNFTKEIEIKEKTINIRGGNTDSNGNSYTVLNANQLCRHFNILSDSNLHIKDCRLINGNAYGSKSKHILHHRGGSIYIGAGFTITNGHALHKKSTLTVDNCQFENNTAEFGGAIYNTKARVEVENSTFKNNKAVCEDGTYKKWNWGGAIRSESITGYYHNDKTDRIYLADGTYTSRTVSGNTTTTMIINLDKKQNYSAPQNFKLAKENLLLYQQNTKRITPVSVKWKSDYQYEIVIDGGLSMDSNYYFVFKGNANLLPTYTTFYRAGSGNVLKAVGV